jgi:hypothetical protein
MTQPCSNDLRERAMARLAAGWSIRAIAAALLISPSSSFGPKTLAHSAAAKRLLVARSCLIVFDRNAC